MRIGHPTPLPTLEPVARAAAFVVAGVIVLHWVQGWGALLIGSGLVAYGVASLVVFSPPQRAVAPRTAPKMVPGARHEKITHVRERTWMPPAA